MNLTQVLPLFAIIPFLGFIITLILPNKEEGWISKSTFGLVGLQIAGILAYVTAWMWQGHPIIQSDEFVLYQSGHFSMFICFFFDTITLFYLLVGGFITFMITIYSRYYMHREKGYKRFFNTIMFFFLGYNITIMSGNIETLFLGWEILGLSSFLLIAFYRERHLPVKNAMKVYSVYRLGDVGIILAMWMAHHFWKENITFYKLHHDLLLSGYLEKHTITGAFIGIMILSAAAVKSAQLPFSSWLPRAMEGPTPSSAIFYGSLSVHIGVFLLLRTAPLWEHQLSVKIMIGLLGLSTSLVTGMIARVQSSVKSQIAYASICQIGLIFIEISLGWYTLALFHFAGNAFLRTYQLLVSPSVVSYLIRQQFYNFVPRPLTIEDSLPKKIENTLYIISMKEWNLDTFVFNVYLRPLKWIGRKLEYITIFRVITFFVPSYLIGLFFVYNQQLIPNGFKPYLVYLFSIIGLLMVFKSFAARRRAELAWILICMNHFWVAMAMAFNDEFNYNQIYIYLSGIVVFGTIGYFILLRVNKYEQAIKLDEYHGHVFKHPKLAFTFLLACLGVSGFPISPTFVGEDLMFVHVHAHQYLLAFLLSLGFIIDGLAIIRIYSRLFLGPHKLTPYDMAHHSA